MSTTNKQFSKLLAKYALSRPVSPEDQRYIMKRRRAGLKHILKQKGSYSAVIGATVAISVIFKKMGVSLSILQSKIIAGVTAAAVSAGSAAGGYITADYIRTKIAEREQAAQDEKPVSVVPGGLTTEREIRTYYHKLEEINLDDGTRLVGAVISQDRGIIKIHTTHGMIEVPVKYIRNIRMR